MNKKDSIYLKEHGMLFMRNNLGYFEPIAYNLKEDKDGNFTGTEIKKGNVIYDYIKFVKYAAGTRDKKTGKKMMNGYLDIYQWVMSIYSITMALNFKSEDLMVAISRQAGKSHSSRLIIAFLVAFAPKFAKIEEERFYATICSYKLEVVEELVNKLQERIKDAIDCFNMIYNDIKLEDKSTNQALMLSKRKYEINAVINGNSVPWSSLDGLSLNNTVLNASYTSSLLVVDEGQDILEEHFNTQAKPFSTRTGALSLIFGTSNEVSESLLTSLYFSSAKSIKKVIFPCDEVIKHKKLVSEKHAEKYETTVKNEIEKKGLYSSYIQSQYYCNFNMSNEKLITIEKLKDNNILTGEIETDIRHYNDKKMYKIGAIDPAVSHDRATFVYGVAIVEDSNITSIAKEFVILKDKNETTNSKIIAKKLAEECLANKLDFLIVDNTATQVHQTFEIVSYFLENNIKTQIVPMGWQGQEKIKMYSYMENSFYKQNVILPSLDFKQENIGYKLLLEELVNLRKEKRQGGYTWSAPKGEEFTDDMVSAFGMFNYGMYYTMEKIKKREPITVSTIKYYLSLRKYPKEEQKIQTEQPRQWLCV